MKKSNGVEGLYGLLRPVVFLSPCRARMLNTPRHLKPHRDTLLVGCLAFLEWGLIRSNTTRSTFAASCRQIKGRQIEKTHITVCELQALHAKSATLKKGQNIKILKPKNQANLLAA